MPPIKELYSYYKTLLDYYPEVQTPSGLNRLEICLAVLSGPAKIKTTRVRALAGFLASEAQVAATQMTVEFDAASGAIRLADPQLTFLADLEADELRRRLIAWRGIGPESADALLLHAFDAPVFAVNSRSWRLLRRHGFVGPEADYEEMRELFQAALPEDTDIYRRYYRRITLLGKDFCRSAKFLCSSCPLKPYMEYEPCD
ncbi:MAG: hypothetical protein LBV80_08475 [Deltaproteobacteria bacterium]|nr:hypothetical protein [Deltaproteobacteria bacterium]